MYDSKENVIEQGIKQKIDNYLTRLKRRIIFKPKNCQICNHAGKLEWHGSYIRSLITFTQLYYLPIKRIFCAHCNHTFACIPEFVEKFRQYAKGAIRFAVRMLKTQTYEEVANLFTPNKERYIAILTLYHWCRKFA